MRPVAVSAASSTTETTCSVRSRCRYSRSAECPLGVIADLVAELRLVLQAHTEHMVAFREVEKNLEDWFKGEMIVVLRRMKAAGTLTDYRVEPYTDAESKRRYDFVVPEPPRAHAIENKTWLIGTQKDQVWDAHRYLFGETGKAHRLEMDKLLEWEGGERFLLWFCYANPGQEAWDATLDAFEGKFAAYRFDRLSQPRDYPPEFFIGLLRLKQLEANS